MSRRTFIYCPTGHAIGEIVRKNLDGEMVPALYVYERSVFADLVPVDLPAKRMVVIGHAVGIECSICRREQSWTMSNKTAVTVMVGLLNALYEPAVKRDHVTSRQNCNDV